VSRTPSARFLKAANGVTGAICFVDRRGDPTTNRDELENFSIEGSVDDDRACLAVGGDLDVASAWLLLRRVDGLAKRPLHLVELRLAGLSFVDSAGLRALVLVQRQLQRAGIELRLTEVPPAVERLLDVTGLGVLFSAADYHATGEKPVDNIP